MWDEERELRMARYRARFLSWRTGRRVAQPTGNYDGCNSHWIHQPFRYETTGEPVTMIVPMHCPTCTCFKR